MSFQPMDGPIPIYVPVGDAVSVVRPSSAIVGSPGDEGVTIIDFEDGKYVPGVFADLVERAWGRHSTRYPTIARAWVKDLDLVLVGWFDPARGTIYVEEPELLEAWAPGALDHLLTTSGPTAREREYEKFLAHNPGLRFSPADKTLRRTMHLD